MTSWRTWDDVWNSCQIPWQEPRSIFKNCAARNAAPAAIWLGLNWSQRELRSLERKNVKSTQHFKQEITTKTVNIQYKNKSIPRPQELFIIIKPFPSMQEWLSFSQNWGFIIVFLTKTNIMCVYLTKYKSSRSDENNPCIFCTRSGMELYYCSKIHEVLHPMELHPSPGKHCYCMLVWVTFNIWHDWLVITYSRVVRQVNVWVCLFNPDLFWKALRK